ncbi:unnamed protein product [Spirodela intermedia]|uniref:Uncharacterized protein n=1 Tax=Spirodela intermedia TaxID=51605 RepID=A0A7I8J606_SPIIN|nr:unnamed protein product [Spirodela intermedia]CAA6665195.1 unnamed protein product [Spirodela intermedia]
MGGRRPCFAALVLIPAILSLFLLQGFARNVKTAKFDGETFRTVFPGNSRRWTTASRRQHQSRAGSFWGSPLPGHPPPPPPPQSVY